MVAKRFCVKYRPFPESDLTSEMILYELNENSVIDFFKRNYPCWQIAEITEVK